MAQRGDRAPAQGEYPSGAYSKRRCQARHLATLEPARPKQASLRVT